MPSATLIFRDTQLQNLVRSILTASEIAVRDANTPTLGLQLLQKEKANIVITEENCGEIPVEELIKRVKQISPDQPVVVFLMELSMKRALEVMRAGAYDCIEPSFTGDQLAAVVKKAMVRFDSLPFEAGSLVQSKKWWKKPKVYLAVLALLLLNSIYWPYHHWSGEKSKQKLTQAEYESEKEFSLPYAHPSGIAYSNDSIWICDWFSQSIYRHHSETLQILNVYHFADANPTAVTWTGPVLWAVTTDGRIEKHAFDEKLTLLLSVNFGGRTFSGIAHDGSHLWTCDPTLKKVYKHTLDEKLSMVSEYAYPGDSPAGLFWDGKSLWSVDSARKVLLRHDASGNSLLIVEVKAFPQYNEETFRLSGATFDGKRFWSVTESPARVIRQGLKQ